MLFISIQLQDEWRQRGELKGGQDGQELIAHLDSPFLSRRCCWSGGGEGGGWEFSMRLGVIVSSQKVGRSIHKSWYFKYLPLGSYIEAYGRSRGAEMMSSYAGKRFCLSK